MRLIFYGNARVADVLTLQRCVEDGHQIAAVWTQPDCPAKPEIHPIFRKSKVIREDLKQSFDWVKHYDGFKCKFCGHQIAESVLAGIRGDLQRKVEERVRQY